jgi:hypothetical protein
MIEDIEFNRLFDTYDEFCADVGMMMVMVSARGPSIVVVMMVVMKNLMTVIFLASCCMTLKQS